MIIRGVSLSGLQHEKAPNQCHSNIQESRSKMNENECKQSSYIGPISIYIIFRLHLQFKSKNNWGLQIVVRELEKESRC